MSRGSECLHRHPSPAHRSNFIHKMSSNGKFSLETPEGGHDPVGNRDLCPHGESDSRGQSWRSTSECPGHGAHLEGLPGTGSLPKSLPLRLTPNAPEPVGPVQAELFPLLQRSRKKKSFQKYPRRALLQDWRSKTKSLALSKPEPAEFLILQL